MHTGKLEEGLEHPSLSLSADFSEAASRPEPDAQGFLSRPEVNKPQQPFCLSLPSELVYTSSGIWTPVFMISQQAHLMPSLRSRPIHEFFVFCFQTRTHHITQAYPGIGYRAQDSFRLGLGISFLSGGNTGMGHHIQLGVVTLCNCEASYCPFSLFPCPTLGSEYGNKHTADLSEFADSASPSCAWIISC